MRQRLAQRKRKLVQVEGALEHHRHDIERRLRRDASLEHFVEPGLMMLALLRDAGMQAHERPAVRRQHQGIGRQRRVFVQ